jgi:Fungal specific transcription factor domain
VWILTGIAVRMGQRLKLHSDKESLGFSIFETEVRRRVWWQILLIDSRSAQLSGTYSPGMANISHTALPANLNDVDLNPDMTEIPIVHKGPTEMIFCLLRYEFGKFLYTNGKKLNSPAVLLPGKDLIIDELENYLECNFLRYCDPAIPLHLLSVGGARSAICKMRLVAHHPSQWPDKGASMSQSERNMLFSTSIKMVEYDILGLATKAVEHFLWHINVYFQLDAFVFMLVESRNQPFGPLADKAWCLVSETYKYHPELITDEMNELYVAVGELALRVWDARAADVARRIQEAEMVPSCISTLRARRAKKTTVMNTSSIVYSSTMPEEFDHERMTQQCADSVDGQHAESHIYQNHIDHTDNGDSSLYDTGSRDDVTAEWESMDWEYWNHLLESNMAHQPGTQQLFG